MGAFVVALVLALAIIYAVGALRDDNSPSSDAGSVASPSPSGAEVTDGSASFVGHASNAVMFIQWTRDGGSVTGSLQEAITKRPSGSGLSSEDRPFTGSIHGDGLTLDVQGAEASAYVGEVKGSGFTLTLPGQGSTLTTISFSPGEVSAYNSGTRELLVSEYSSPCDLYVVGHDVRMEVTGANAAEACADFVQKAGARAEWTTAPQPGTEEGGVVCEVEDRANEKAAVTDSGGQEYGHEACEQLSGEGWG
jgi:hypothetical protein